MFEGDFADMCAEKYPLVLMGAWAEGLACADPGASATIGGSGNFTVFFPMIVHSILKDFVSILKQIFFSNLHLFLRIVLIHLYVNL